MGRCDIEEERAWRKAACCYTATVWRSVTKVFTVRSSGNCASSIEDIMSSGGRRCLSVILSFLLLSRCPETAVTLTVNLHRLRVQLKCGINLWQLASSPSGRRLAEPGTSEADTSFKMLSSSLLPSYWR